MNLSIFRDKYYQQSKDRDVYCYCDRKYRDPSKRREMSEDFFSLFIEKNSDGTRNLRLKGNELQYRIGRRIETPDMKLVTTFIKKYSTLVKLDLSYNRINNEGIGILCEGYLSRPNPLEALVLIGCDIGCGGIHAICKNWKTIKLKILRLTANKFGSECGTDIYTLLSKNKILEQLDMGATGQSSASFPFFMSALSENNYTLKSLDLSDILPISRVYQPQPEVLAYHLSRMLTENNVLEEIHLQKCGLDGHAIESMIIGLRENTTLLFLDIGYNKIGCFGAEKLADWFMSSPQMLGINLAGNSIGEIGARALSFGLPYSKLRLLDLSQNKIKDQGLSEILLSIKKSERMRLFYIFGNEIGPLSKEILERQYKADVYEQQNIDFQLFHTTEGLKVAKYPVNNYKQLIYNQLQPHEVRELRIRRNQLPGYYCAQHGKVNFDNYKIATGPCRDDPLYEPPPFDEDKLRQRCLERERLAAEDRESTVESSMVAAEASSDSCLEIPRMASAAISPLLQVAESAALLQKPLSSNVFYSDVQFDFLNEDKREATTLEEVLFNPDLASIADPREPPAEKTIDIAMDAMAARMGITNDAPAPDSLSMVDSARGNKDAEAYKALK